MKTVINKKMKTVINKKMKTVINKKMKTVINKKMKTVINKKMKTVKDENCNHQKDENCNQQKDENCSTKTIFYKSKSCQLQTGSLKKTIYEIFPFIFHPHSSVFITLFTAASFHLAAFTAVIMLADFVHSLPRSEQHFLTFVTLGDLNRRPLPPHSGALSS